jgi:biofilm PGA synthesis N-glycosyltransferase PgaC
MGLIVFLFWISLAVIFYCFFGYSILVLLTGFAGLLKKKKTQLPQQIPGVTLIITAYLEDRVLLQKIENSLALTYPVKILFVLDAPTSALHLFGRYPSVKVIYQPERKGKYEAIKRAMKEVDTPIVVFSDANSMLNRESIEKIVSHYADPGTGAVAGEKKIINTGSSTLGEAEGIYWKYESFMKRCDAELYTVTGAAGELYSIRTELFRPLNEAVIVDDLVISMQVCLQGYRIAYEPGAFSEEPSPGDLEAESRRRVRIAAGVYQAMGRLKGTMNFIRRPMVAFQFFSRRVLRWFICPLLLPLVLLLNILIVAGNPAKNIYTFFLVGQGLLYLLALIGWMLIRNGSRAGIFSVPFYFLFMNYCMLLGFFRYLGKKQPATWEKAER